MEINFCSAIEINPLLDTKSDIKILLSECRGKSQSGKNYGLVLMVCNPFYCTVLFLYPLKTSETRVFLMFSQEK